MLNLLPEYPQPGSDPSLIYAHVPPAVERERLYTASVLRTAPAEENRILMASGNPNTAEVCSNSY